MLRTDITGYKCLDTHIRNKNNLTSELNAWLYLLTGFIGQLQLKILNFSSQLIILFQVYLPCYKKSKFLPD